MERHVRLGQLLYMLGYQALRFVTFQSRRDRAGQEEERPLPPPGMSPPWGGPPPQAEARRLW
ncbi:hypothetical protein SMC26_03435 [Actinomadura fulvescens]|uniref:hypothetical protein n=1 Tax=Actinomadura fulvescens TaxID=46160 RepID=UPI0031D4DE04